MTDMPRRIALWLTLCAVAIALVGIAGYHAAVTAGQFIPRAEMAALSVTVLLSTVTVAATIAAVAKRQASGPAGIIAYRGQPFVNAPTAAFILGMLAYLIVYPPTPWVFDTMLALAFVFGFMLALPIHRPDLPPVVALLNGFAGLAACAAGFALGNGLLIMAGLLVAIAGFLLAIRTRHTMTRSLYGALCTAFREARKR